MTTPIASTGQPAPDEKLVRTLTAVLGAMYSKTDYDEQSERTDALQIIEGMEQAGWVFQQVPQVEQPRTGDR